MTVKVSVEQGAQLGTALDELLAAEPELAYANFAPLEGRTGAAVALHRERWDEAADQLGSLVARDQDGRALGALQMRRRPVESEHFGLCMARIEPPLAVSEEVHRVPALRALYAAAFHELRGLGQHHLAARASTRDRVAGWVLQELGAHHVDTQVSWMAPLSGAPHDQALPEPLRFEVHEPPDLRSLPPSAWKRIVEWAGVAFLRGPLVFDLDLPRRRAQGVYEQWTRKVSSGEWADALLVVRDADEIVAFISMRVLDDVSRAAGVRVCGRGLGATLPEYRGLFTALQREMIARRPLDASFMENETQVSTLGSINVYAKLGFRYLRSTSSFHLRFDGAGARCA